MSGSHSEVCGDAEAAAKHSLHVDLPRLLPRVAAVRNWLCAAAYVAHRNPPGTPEIGGVNASADRNLGWCCSRASVYRPLRLAQRESGGVLPRVKKAIRELMPMSRSSVCFGDRIAAGEQRGRGLLSIHSFPADRDVQALVSRVCVARVHDFGRRSLPRRLLCALASQPSVR